MVDRGWTGVEGRKNIHARRGTKSRSDMTASQYCHRRTRRKVEDNGVGREELLVARDDEGNSKVHGRIVRVWL